MPIQVNCASCNASLRAPDKAAGKGLKCPKCSAPILVPIPVTEAIPESISETPIPAPSPLPAAVAQSAPSYVSAPTPFPAPFDFGTADGSPMIPRLRRGHTPAMWIAFGVVLAACIAGGTTVAVLAMRKPAEIAQL